MQDEWPAAIPSSDIVYSVCAREEILVGDSAPSRRAFPPITGRVIASAMFRLRASGRGKNVLTLLSSSGAAALSIWCEGMAVYAHSGGQRVKIADYRDDAWFRVAVRADTEARAYDVFVDGRKCASRAAFAQDAGDIAAVDSGSRMGDMRVKLLFVYKNPTQSAMDAGLPVLDAAEAGVESDGRTVVTAKLQALVDRCSASGGGVVRLGTGTFLSGAIRLKAGVRLYLEPEATLKGVLGVENYPLLKSAGNPNWNMLNQGPQRALVYADGLDGVVIEGGGTIDGSGDFSGDYGSESDRPSAILLVGCPGVRLRDVHVKDAGMWTIPLVECDGFHLRDLNLDTVWFPNRDGIDPCDCHGGLVEHCSITAADDAVCFKSGELRGCRDIAVRDCLIASVMANAVKFGTYSHGGFSRCSVRDCVIKNTRHAAVCIESVDGGRIEDLAFERLDISDSGSAFLAMIGDRGKLPPGAVRKVGSVERILFADLVVEGLRRNYGSYVSGYSRGGVRYPIRDLRFERVKASFRGGAVAVPATPPEYDGRYPECDMFGPLPASAFYFRHCDGVRFIGCDIDVPERDARQKIVSEDSKVAEAEGQPRKAQPPA